MSKLEGERIPDPIADDLRPALSDERLDRIWRDVALARAESGARSSVLRVVRTPAFALAVAACALLAVFFVVSVRDDAQLAAARSLTQADGTAIEAIAPNAAEAHVGLSDGSELWVDKGAVLAPLDVSERSVVLHLVRGRARFSVKPGGPRRWVIEAGVASVEVVGTRFTVDRSAGGVGVEVQEGKVLVRGTGLPDGLVRLTAGEQVEVPSSPEATAGAVSEPSAPPAQGITVEATVEMAAEPAQAPAPSGKPAVPKVGPSPAPEPPAKPDADALFKLADAARIARDYAGAVAALERVIQEHAGDPRAKLAAFTIGRIRDEHLHDLAGATAAYEKALALGLAGSLADDCYGRLLHVLEAQVREGKATKARWAQTAEQYVQRYPKGRYAGEARRALEGKPAP